MRKRTLLLLVVCVCFGARSPNASAEPPAKSAAEPQLSFRDRVQEFWIAFATNEARYRKVIADRQAPKLAQELSGMFSTLLAGASWELAPGSSAERTALVLSAPSNVSHQLLIEEWVRAAPEGLPWDVLGAKPAIPGAAQRPHLDMGARQYAAKDILFTARVEAQAQLVHLVVYHASFADAGERERGNVAFVWLDWLLGERVVERRVGKIDFALSKPEHSDGSFADLPTWFEQASKAWGPVPPAFGKRFEYAPRGAKQGAALRKDITKGETSVKATVSRPEENPLDQTGAAFGYVALSGFTGAQPDWKVLRELEDAIHDVLWADGLGRSTGCAIGLDRLYVDLLLTDVGRALPVVRALVAKRMLGASAAAWHASWGAARIQLMPAPQAATPAPR